MDWLPDMKKFRRYFNRFGATHERVGRTDRQTDRQTDGQTPSDTSKKHSVNKIAIIMHSIARQKYMLCVCMSMCIHRYTPLDTWSIQLFFMFIHIHTCIASILFISSFVKHHVSNAYHTQTIHVYAYHIHRLNTKTLIIVFFKSLFREFLNIVFSSNAFWSLLFFTLSHHDICHLLSLPK